ncbi:cobalamin B12-binding domain-containing protein [Alsobacter sp. R-9]
MSDDHGEEHDGSQAIVAGPYIAPEILQGVDLPARRQKLARIIESDIVPRLMTLHGGKAQAPSADDARPTVDEVATLARMMIDPDVGPSSNYVSELKGRGLSTERLFLDLLSPTARCLGAMWENDKCDFIDVALGVARLQQVLSAFSASIPAPAVIEKRRVCMMTLGGEGHSFGISMVETFLRAGGWRVDSRRGVELAEIPGLMAGTWHAVAGLTIGTDGSLDELAAIIRSIRQTSCNPCIGIMVGGPPFAEHAELAARVGADATAIDAPTAVLLAQRLFDLGARTNWRARDGSGDRAGAP